MSVRTSSHYLDWDNRPYPFKVYENQPLIPLPREFPHPSTSAIDAISTQPQESRSVDVSRLAELLFFSGGLTRKMTTRAGVYYMRAAAATGALYPIELYAACTDIPGLAAGVYHFNPLAFGLVRLREGDYMAWLADASGRTGLVRPITLAFTSIAWRNAWKYEARSYRHWFWDSGVIVANLLAASNSAGLATEVVIGFVDSELDQLLGLEAKKEATVALAVVGGGRAENASRMHQPIPSLSLDVSPLSREEVDYPIIWETNDASALKSKSETESWRTSLGRFKRNGPPTTLAFPLRDMEWDPSPPLDEVILLRGSTRKFAREPISFNRLSTIIRASATDIPLDFLSDNETLIDFYFIANDVEGLPAGSYFYNVDNNSVEQLKLDRNRSMSGYLCLGQQLFSDASVVFFLMTNLTSALKSLGNRGYRAAQFEAGVRAGKVYLSSYAVGIGASGSTFFDDAVTEFFSPHAKGKSPMIAVGVGVPGYKARPGKVLPQITIRAQTF